MQKTLQDLGLKFGRAFIAKNLNFYKMAKPTPEFWDYYKEHKDALKAAGFSVFKHSELGFMVYDWTSKEQATQSDFDAQEKEREQYEKTRLECAIEQLELDVQDRGPFGESVNQINSWKEFHAELERLYTKPDFIWENQFKINIPVNFYEQ